MQLVEDLEHPTSIVNINDKMSVDTMEVELNKIPDLSKTDDVPSTNEIIPNNIIDDNDDKSKEKNIPISVVNINDTMSVDTMEVEVNKIPNLISKAADDVPSTYAIKSNDIIDNNDDKSEKQIIPTSIVNFNEKMSVDTVEVVVNKIPDLISKTADDVPTNEKILNDIIDKDDKSEEKNISMEVDIDLKNNLVDEVNNIELSETINNVIGNLDKELEETADSKCIDKVNNVEIENILDNCDKHLDKLNNIDIEKHTDLNNRLSENLKIEEKCCKNVDDLNNIKLKNINNENLNVMENDAQSKNINKDELINANKVETATVNNDDVYLDEVEVDNNEVKEIIKSDNKHLELTDTVNNEYEELNNKNYEKTVTNDENNLDTDNIEIKNISGCDNKQLQQKINTEGDEVQLDNISNNQLTITINNEKFEMSNNQNNCQETPKSLNLENAGNVENIEVNNESNSLEDNIIPLNKVSKNNELVNAKIANVNTDKSEIAPENPEKTIIVNLPNTLEMISEQENKKSQSPSSNTTSEMSEEITKSETIMSKETEIIKSDIPEDIHQEHKTITSDMSEDTCKETETITSDIPEDTVMETETKAIVNSTDTLNIASVQENDESQSNRPEAIDPIEPPEKLETLKNESETITSGITENIRKQTKTKVINNTPEKVDNLNTEENNKSQSLVPDIISKTTENDEKSSMDVFTKSTKMEIDVQLNKISQQQNKTEMKKKSEIDDEIEIMEIDEVECYQKLPEKNNDDKTNENKQSKSCLVNTLDIISDDEDETMKDVNKTCIDLDEDDDIMLIEDECNDVIKNTQKSSAEIQDNNTDSDKNTDNKDEKPTSNEDCISLDEEDVIPVLEKEISVKNAEEVVNPEDEETKTLIEVAEKVEKETIELKEDESILTKNDNDNNKDDLFDLMLANDASKLPELKFNDGITKKTDPDITMVSTLSTEMKECPKDETITPREVSKPLVTPKFITSFKSKISEMSRDELEEFCLLKIVEGITDRINMGEIKTKLKTMTQHVEEWRKKAMTLLKQTRDLQIVLEKVQEEYTKSKTVTPMRITRSVGMQVFMSVTKTQNRNKKNPPPPNKAIRTPNPQKVKPNQNNVSPQTIPVPKLVPVTPQPYTPKKTPNGVTKASPANKADKRPFNSIQSVTVDLTDDEPPTKQPAITKNQSVRLVSPQQLMTRPQFLPQSGNSPRKVFIPISGQSQNIRSGQTIMFKTMQPMPRTRTPNPTNMRMTTPNNARNPRLTRHPAPLPDAAKQAQPPNWKALPPSPDLKISKVDNGIVISWKIEGYQEDSYEEIASYQLYAYQETSSPPSTSLWKKIGDVKALPLPMACTLTQFMAGYKYYFAVRAVDVRSRIGPFSLPGSILLLNK